MVYQQGRRGPRIGCFFPGMIVGAILMFVVFIMLSGVETDINALQSTMQGYISLGATGKIATICVTTSNVQHSLKVYLKQYDQQGKFFQQYDQHGKLINAQLIAGDQVRVQDSIITIQYQPLMSIVHLQSGLKLTGLEGYYTNANDERTLKHSSITLNGGEDAEFTKLQHNPSPVATASLDNPLVIPTDGKTYDLYASQSGLIRLPDPHSPAGCKG
ncbi:MAG TPA: hypothetical protein VEV19_16735 [Ktedonobacteraceae bacterium]|nr:hypothetical protein [Ktedonobacteraceae bacterium]